MEQEGLKPCPFCGCEVDNHKDDCYFRMYSVAFADSLVSGKPGMNVHVSARELRDAWNTRYEPTCTMEKSRLSTGLPYQDVYICSKCNEQVIRGAIRGISEQPNYCPHCGAKTVEP